MDHTFEERITDKIGSLSRVSVLAGWRRKRRGAPPGLFGDSSVQRAHTRHRRRSVRPLAGNPSRNLIPWGGRGRVRA